MAEILLVDDYEPNRDIALLFLRSGGYTVVEANNGNRAIELCSRKKFDLIIMDIQMPNIDGIEASRRIKENNGLNSSTPILGLTALPFSIVSENSEELVFNDIVIKPFKKKKLLGIIEYWVNTEITNKMASFNNELNKNRSEILQKKSVILDFDEAVIEFGSEELVFNVIREFQLRLDTQIGLIKNAINGKKYNSISREAHSIRGGATTLEAYFLSEAAGMLEEASDKQDIHLITSAFDNMLIEVRNFNDFVQNLLNTDR